LLFAGARYDEDNVSESGDDVAMSPVSQEFVAGMRFDEQPVDAVVLRGNDVTFNCSVSTDADVVGPDGEQLVELSWRKDGETVWSGDARRTVFPDGRLVIEKVQSRAVIGVYECVATSPDGVLVSRPANLDIASKSPIHS
jgi:Immunoglobulin domain